jgi:putative SOS response-associated peptidase YedK
MCYTIKIDMSREELEKRFGARFTDPERYRPGSKVNAFSVPALPVITRGHPDEIRLYYWGLIPFWVRDRQAADSIRKKTFNARSESLGEKPSYRNLINRRHCLVLANGFYEWQTTEKRKIPYFIGLREHPAFALAGLYDYWTDKETGEIIPTFTVITTRANPMMEEIHNIKKRMPVILSPDEERKWLEISNDKQTGKVFEPFPQEMMFAEQG